MGNIKTINERRQKYYFKGVKQIAIVRTKYIDRNLEVDDRIFKLVRELNMEHNVKGFDKTIFLSNRTLSLNMYIYDTYISFSYQFSEK